MKKYLCVILGLGLTLSVWDAAAQEPLSKFSALRVLDFPIPFCDASVRLDVAADQFVEIENDLPGRSEYNRLIRLYQKKNWFDLSSALGEFRKQFESSPLIEAIDFLELQAELEQVPEKNETALQKIQNKFRDLLILYPRSSLNPVLQASMANHFLRTGAYAKALGLYRAGREDNPYHEVSCTHLFGESEANFLLGNYEDSERTFRSVIQKCPSNRLQIAARVRLVDIQRENKTNLKTLEKEYEKIREENPTLVSRFHPELLYNLGEIKYRNQNYPSSTFYFNDFARSVPETHSCQPSLHKRLADLSVHNKKNNKEIIGSYLSVFEKYPKTDLGKFSRIHAMLLDFSRVSDSEAQRRLEIIATEVASMRDAQIKDHALIEKNLSLLERRDTSGLEELKPLKSRHEDIFQGDLNRFIRQTVLEQIKPSNSELAHLNEKAKDKKILEPLELYYADWFRQTPESQKAEMLYRDLILERYGAALEAKNPKAAVNKLERWKASDLFQKKWADDKTRIQIGGLLANWWVKQPMGSNQAFAKFFLERKEELKEIYGIEGNPLWIQADMELSQLESLGRDLASSKENRQVEKVSAYALILGRAYRLTKDFRKSEYYLNRVSDPKLSFEKTVEQIRTLTSLGKTKAAIEIGLREVERKSSESNKEILPLLRDAVVSGKQWNSADSVLKAVRRAIKEDKQLAPFLTMQGRALLEKGKCKEANEVFSEALKKEPEAKEVAETKFNIGRCMALLKDMEGAKKTWQEVASLKDELWSPLAANELKLLEKP